MAPGSEIEYDLRKQQDTLQHRGLDFNDAPRLCWQNAVDDGWPARLR